MHLKLADEETDIDLAALQGLWIVNPLDETITVLGLQGDVYATHGVFRRGEWAISTLLDGFRVNVDEVFAAR